MWEQVEAERQAWLTANAEENARALETSRSFVPPDIWSTDQHSLLRRGLTEPQAKRVWKTKVGAGRKTGVRGRLLLDDAADRPCLLPWCCHRFNRRCGSCVPTRRSSPRQGGISR